MASMTIADLPEVVLERVFSYLDVLAVCNAALVCRTFLRIARMYRSVESLDAVYPPQCWQTGTRLDVCACRHSPMVAASLQ